MFVIMPSVQSAYQIISQLTIILYLIMYMLMFASGIYLRYREPNTPRTFRIPGAEPSACGLSGASAFWPAWRLSW
nr:amino acid permease [Akkermansia muciniphila]